MRNPIVSLVLPLLFVMAAQSRAEEAKPQWAFVPPHEAGAGEGIDTLVQAEVARHGLKPTPRAAPGTLLRRVTLDLTGLPPTPAEAADFLRDPSREAYARVVDRLLASPSFGERWATMWLDLARYADTQGYEKDNLRTIWAYRDWVIQAFNDDLPFDRFTIEQLAGDLLPQPTVDQLTATAFHRNTLTNTEGGTDDEEFRMKAVIDRANTTATVWLALTIGCAQCHDHPTDPITQREFYQFLAFFNNTADCDRDDEKPTMELVPIGERARAVNDQRETSVPIIRELTGAEARTTHVLHRGNFLRPEEVVGPGVPAFLPGLKTSAPANRLDLARWLVNGRNPLTARVMVNRLWAQLFGRGLVETEENFGKSGSAPSHAALLDHLATRFAGPLHWSMKALLREIVLSETYRQSSAATPAQRALDPENRWLARGPRVPLTAEMVRDQALAVSGLLSDKMYGRPVMPPQPEGTWQVVYNVQRWVISRGEDRYRRGIYTFWRRTSPYPGLALLGTPSREECTPRRSRGNTPAEALVTLNDPVFAEAAEALARRMNAEGGATLDERLRYGWRLLLGTEPSERSLIVLRQIASKPASDNAVPAQAAAALLNLDAVLMKD